ncbi:MAG: hypothetical protein OSB05_12540 [Akkermansiaceae bacterium]|nr:hypothetical protein [Akkermansiaceae bacterium]
MKKQFAAASAIGMALAGSLCAQSLFDLAPDDDQKESLPLKWSVGANLGHDNNPTPLLGNDDESAYGQAYVGATFLTNTPQTTLSFGTQLGVIHYFDNLDVLGTDVDDTSFTASLYLNWTHRLSERLRIVSRNTFSYELEPDYSTGFQSQRQIGNYLRWSTDNALGYRWSERLATYTGIRLNGLSYDETDLADRDTILAYNDFRYQLSDRTVTTLTYRHAQTTGGGAVTDSTNQYVLAGLEHRFSPQTTGVIRAGVQIRDVDKGQSGTSPYAEASLKTQINEQLSLKAYGRYGIEDYARALRDLNTRVFSVYSDTDSLRLGLTANYQISQDLALNAGVNYAGMEYNNLLSGQSPRAAASVGENLLNTYVGFDLKVSDNVYLNGRYNVEDLESDAGRDYDRNRFSVGVSTTF